jgi:hypothetical protein
MTHANTHCWPASDCLNRCHRIDCNADYVRDAGHSSKLHTAARKLSDGLRDALWSGPGDSTRECRRLLQLQCQVCGFSPNREQATYTGIKWQCVEFARRWLLDNEGVVYGDVDIASDIWSKIPFVTRISDGRQLPLQPHLNGASEPPQVGDLLVYAREYLNTGHVAVVTEVDLNSGVIRVAEQNFLNQKWPANYARQIEIVHKDERYWLLDPYLLGWKRVVS